jgi:hypothetical protein
MASVAVTRRRVTIFSFCLSVHRIYLSRGGWTCTSRDLSLFHWGAQRPKLVTLQSIIAVYVGNRVYRG